MAEDAEIANIVDDMDGEYYDKDDDSEEVELDGYDIGNGHDCGASEEGERYSENTKVEYY
ncbi:hypothetical protein Scep_006533 [Stephania cephalantha]|uniref:Uncharacterized protein n=1 Tax=Stephania cephalantha TaxID=152367 RepID=A0AAP0PP46_9MAGN